MEHVTAQALGPHLEECKKIVSETIALEKYDLTDEEMTILTKEIMETSLMMGGDFEKESIRQITLQYIFSDFIERFLKAHR